MEKTSVELKDEELKQPAGGKNVEICHFSVSPSCLEDYTKDNYKTCYFYKFCGGPIVCKFD